MSKNYKIKEIESGYILSEIKDFDFNECKAYLTRNDKEILHRFYENGHFFKSYKINNRKVLIKIHEQNKELYIEFITNSLSTKEKHEILKNIIHKFDLDRDLKDFFDCINKDKILSKRIFKYKGLRLIKSSNLFETLSWSVIGQQINLNFAYMLKKSLVENYGEYIEYKDMKYYIFPDYEKIKKLRVEDLKQLKYSTRKAEYLIGLAKEFSDNDFEKKINKLSSYEDLKYEMIKIRGIGEWSADYTLMRYFGNNNVLLTGDVGLQNAIKNVYNLAKKPTKEEMKSLFSKWQENESYITFYLWRTLLD